MVALLLQPIRSTVIWQRMELLSQRLRQAQALSTYMKSVRISTLTTFTSSKFKRLTHLALVRYLMLQPRSVLLLYLMHLQSQYKSQHLTHRSQYHGLHRATTVEMLLQTTGFINQSTVIPIMPYTRVQDHPVSFL
jgi:hypothetical protein